MSGVDLSENIRNAMDLSGVFITLHKGEPWYADAIDKDIVLPFLILNPKNYHDMIKELCKDPSCAFRFKCMKDLLLCPISPLNQQLLSKLSDKDFEHSSPEQRLSLIHNDILTIFHGEHPSLISKPHYSQYFSDALVIYYSRFCKACSFQAIIKAAFEIGNSAILRLAFAFPHFIIPLINHALQAQSPNLVLLCYLSALSPTLWPILHPRFKNFPQLFAPLAIRFFPDDAPDIIISTLPPTCGGFKNDLFKIKDQFSSHSEKSRRFFLCYTRCCAIENKIEPRDCALLLKCPDDSICLALLSIVDSISTSNCNDFLNKFQASPNSLAELFIYYCACKRSNSDLLDNRIQSALGNGFRWHHMSPFFNTISSNIHSIAITPASFGIDQDIVYLLGGLVDEIGTEKMMKFVPSAFLALSSIDQNVINAIEQFSIQLSKDLSFAQQPNIAEPILMSIISQVVNIHFPIIDYFTGNSIIPTNLRGTPQEPLFSQVEKLKETKEYNPAPSIACAILIFTSVMNGAPVFLLNQLPLRFIMAECYISKKCRSIYSYLAEKCQIYAPYIFSQSDMIPFSSFSCLDLALSVAEAGDPIVFLNTIKMEIQSGKISVDEKKFEQWKLLRFSSSFNFSFETLTSLGSPLRFEQTFHALDLPSNVISNIYTLQMALISVHDLLTFFLTINDKDSTPGTLIFAKCITLLENEKNPQTIKIICNFLSDFIYTFPWFGVLFEKDYGSKIAEILAENLSILSNSENFILSLVQKQNCIIQVSELISYLIKKYKKPSWCECAKAALDSLNNLFEIRHDDLRRIISLIYQIFLGFPQLEPNAEHTLNHYLEVVHIKFPYDSITETSIKITIDQMRKKVIQGYISPSSSNSF